MPRNNLEGMPGKCLYCNFTTNIRAWSLLNVTGTLTGTVFYGVTAQFIFVTAQPFPMDNQKSKIPQKIKTQYKTLSWIYKILQSQNHRTRHLQKLNLHRKSLPHTAKATKLCLFWPGEPSSTQSAINQFPQACRGSNTGNVTYGQMKLKLSFSATNI